MPNGGTREEVPTAMVMTIGALSRRTGVPVKMLRDYEDLGLIYTVGRSAGNYRLFGEEALWCVGVVGGLRDLGLTLHEIRELAGGGPTGCRRRRREAQRMAPLPVPLRRLHRACPWASREAVAGLRCGAGHRLTSRPTARSSAASTGCSPGPGCRRWPASSPS